jgi:drug/metabolite transporter (DMT)-like permease
MAYFLFGEKLSAVALAGMVIGIAGVALATRRPDIVAPEP